MQSTTYDPLTLALVGLSLGLASLTVPNPLLALAGAAALFVL